MADNEFIAPIQGGGQQGAQRENAGGPDYRQLQSPEQVRTDLPSSGAAERAAALSSAFKEFEGVTSDVSDKLATQAGALAGAASGATGHPQYRQGLQRLTAYSQAFNTAATGAYAIEAEAQADDAAARLRVQANNDPTTFNTTYSAVRDAVLKNAPPQAVPMLTELYNKKLAQGMAAISGDQASEIQLRQRQTWDEGVQRQTSRVATLQGSENAQDQLAAQDEQVKLSLMIDGGANSGLYSKATAEAMHINAAREVTSQVFSTQVDRELAKPDGDVADLMERFRQAHIANLNNPNEPTVLSEPEYQKLYQDAATKVREQKILDSLLKAQGKTAEQMKFEAGDVNYTSMLLSRQLTDKQLTEAVRNGDLKPERATALHAMLEHADTPTNKDALLKAYQNPHRLDWTADEVANLPNISGADKLKLWNDTEKARGTWEGTQWSKDAVSSISAALKIPPGTTMAAMSDEQKKAFVDATEEYKQQMNALDPSKRAGSAGAVAQTVIQNAQRREAAAELQRATTARQSFIERHGPGSDGQVSDKIYQENLKRYDADIARFSAQVKGQ